MPLEYGMGRWLNANNPKRIEIQERFDKQIKPFPKKLTFFHSSLPFVCMFTDIGIITEKTIPVVVNRLEIFNEDMLRNIEKNLGDLKLALKDFIGFTCNVTTLNTTKFLTRRLQVLREKSLKLTEADIKEAIKEIYPRT